MFRVYSRRLSAWLIRVIGRGRESAPIALLYSIIPSSIRVALRLALARRAAGTGLLVESEPRASISGDEFTHNAVDIAGAASGGGVNLFGYVRGEFGLAENIRSFARALITSNYPVTLLDAGLDVPGRMNDRTLARYISGEPKHAIDLCFVNPDKFPEFTRKLSERSLGRRFTIGFWLWELEQVPEEWRPVTDMVDEIWVPTGFVQDAFERVTGKPVFKVPKAIEFDIPTAVKRRDFGLPEDKCLFLFSFDFHSYFERKNPVAIIEAFREAFPASRNDVRLVIKSVNGDRFLEQYAMLAEKSARDHRIILHDGFLHRPSMYALLSCADAYISLHRSEGFGLGLAESMFLGKPTIATGYSGNLDFMNEENSFLVDYQMIDVGPGEYLASTGQRWADPDVECAAGHMRFIADNRSRAQVVGANGAVCIREKYSMERCANEVISRLNELILNDVGGSNGCHLA